MIYGCARLPVAATIAISVSGLVGGIIYAASIPTENYQPFTRMVVHLLIANAIGYLLKTSFEKREYNLFMLAKKNLRQNVYARELEDQARQLVEAKEKAEVANEAKDRFLAILSHEVRTPMNIIIGTLRLLPAQVGAAVSPAVNELVRGAHSSAESLLGMLDDMLNFARMSAGKVELMTRTFDVRAFVRATLEVFEVNAQIKRLQLSCDVQGVSDATARVMADQQKIRQVLFNLVGNALKFTERGGVRVAVAVLPVVDDAARLVVTVSDTGPGIAPEFQPHLFTPFTQADDSAARKQGGLGLGLATVKGMVEALGGTLGFETSARGTQFRVEFPVRLAPNAPGASDASPASGAPAATVPAVQTFRQVLGQKPVAAAGASAGVGSAASAAARIDHVVQDEKLQLRVLLVEDQIINAQITGFMLEQMGATYVHALDGLEALRLCQEGAPFDLILMDYQMPGMDGPAAAQAIRRWEVETLRRSVPIIALTANATEEARQNCVRAGMDGYLTKPVEFPVLQQAVFTHVTRARLGGMLDASPGGDGKGGVAQ